MRRRFDAIELFLVAVFCLIVGLFARPVTPRPLPPAPPVLVEDDVLKMVSAKYGPEKFSQGPEEWLIRDFFKDRREGVFVDIGAYDARKWSNTYRLEHDLDWRGVAVDALKEFAEGYRTYRERSKFVVAFVGDSDSGSETIHINPRELATSSGNDAFTHLFTQETVARVVPRRTVDGILEEQGVGTVDLLSMDIELGEPVALAHFSIDRYHPALAVVEAQGETRQAILNYFAKHGYVVVGRYLHADLQNLYFEPAPK
jgi:hypothetical protein